MISLPDISKLNVTELDPQSIGAEPEAPKVQSFWSVKAEEPAAPVKARAYAFTSFDEEGGAQQAQVPTAIQPLLAQEPAKPATYKDEARAYLERVRTLAQREAEDILKQAQEKADEIRERAETTGRAAGYEEGYREGIAAGREEEAAALQQRVSAALQEIADVARQVEAEKQRLLDEHLDELRDLTLTIAEKVINVSLKSSGDIIERMIVAATDRSKNQAWAKIYISQYDAVAMVEGDAGIIEAMQHISSNVKVVVNENGERGDCIIEFPDQIIDAGVKTQLDNIKEIIRTGDNG